MTDRLSLYNQALVLIGQRKIASLAENRESRRALDSVWDGGAVNFILEQGLWNCAMRSVKIEADPDVTPSFGLLKAFSRPSDYIRTAALCTDEYFKSPLLQYTDEGGYWYADYEPIYVRYVSNDTAYGGDLSLWPESLAKYAAAYLASEVCQALTADDAKAELLREKTVPRRLTSAQSKDAMNEATAFLPPGSWTTARHGNTMRRDRGNRGSLYG